MAKRKSDKWKADLAARRAKLAEENAKSKAKHDALLAKQPGLNEAIDAEREAIRKRRAEREEEVRNRLKAYIDRSAPPRHEDFPSPPWLHLLTPMQRGWREKQLAKGRDPDARIEQELRKAGKLPPKS